LQNIPNLPDLVVLGFGTGWLEINDITNPRFVEEMMATPNSHFPTQTLQKPGYIGKIPIGILGGVGQLLQQLFLLSHIPGLVI
jgi:hypothetical protein